MVIKKVRISQIFTTKDITKHLIQGYIHEAKDYIGIYHNLCYMAEWMRMMIKEIASLHLGDKVDFRDRNDGRFYFVSIKKKYGDELGL